MEQKLMTMEDATVDYTVVHPVAGHQKNTGTSIVDAAKDIFKRVKEQAMQCSVKGQFITFSTIAELQRQLFSAVQNEYAIGVYDEDITG